jgi:hypothetical protein
MRIQAIVTEGKGSFVLDEVELQAPGLMKSWWR